MTVGPCVRAHQSAIDVPGLGDDAEACSCSRSSRKPLRTIEWSSTSKIRIATGALSWWRPPRSPEISSRRFMGGRKGARAGSALTQRVAHGADDALDAVVVLMGGERQREVAVGGRLCRR